MIAIIANFFALLTSDAQEFSTIIDLLRNEKPIRFNTDGWYVLVGEEPVGEGE
jgi:hypothetical protein